MNIIWDDEQCSVLKFTCMQVPMNLVSPDTSDEETAVKKRAEKRDPYQRLEWKKRKRMKKRGRFMYRILIHAPIQRLFPFVD